MSNELGLSNSIQTLPSDQVGKEVWTDTSGKAGKSRLISRISPVVVRQDNPGGPRYQEALGYTFLINDVKFPGLVRMDDGTLVLTLNGAIQPGSFTDPMKREQVIVFSADDGFSWSQPRRIALHRCTPVNLGGTKLMLRGFLGENDDADPHCLCFSDDAGVTWSNPEPIPHLADGRPNYTDLALHPLVEGDIATFIFYTTASDFKGWKGQSYSRQFHVAGRSWDEPVFFPRKWRTSEGTLVRARNGDLVAAFRSGRPGIQAYSDHWRGFLTARSGDNGKTWSEPDLHFLYGHVHTHLLNLPDGRILLTYAARIGELERRTYHGVEAVVSCDHGKTWDWEHRFILFRWPDECTHSPQSAVLADGRILTVFLHGFGYTWTDGNDNHSNLTNLGNVSAVIWSLE